MSVGLNNISTDIHNYLVSVYGDIAYSYKIVAKWAAAFKSERESIEDESGSRRPRTESTNANINMVEQLIDENPRISYANLKGTIFVYQMHA